MEHRGLGGILAPNNCCVASGKVPASLNFEPICKEGVVIVPHFTVLRGQLIWTASKVLSSVLGFQVPAIYSCFILLFVLGSLVSVITANDSECCLSSSMDTCKELYSTVFGGSMYKCEVWLVYIVVCALFLCSSPV